MADNPVDAATRSASIFVGAVRFGDINRKNVNGYQIATALNLEDVAYHLGLYTDSDPIGGATKLSDILLAPDTGLG
ncbi:hypothetical protein PIB30_048984 [Stylosanthes scabra]|uniref:Uncharacterized protein n=1 Tax=Stylosanthes scabra TaxID=79078 RepID=A0ABU6WH92_9FABA|nr:hypothetical protein [Stylosanthes scabra]